MSPVDINGLLGLRNEVTRVAGDLVGVSDLRTGRESPLDPTAPGNKTMALLERSGVNVKDYITEMSKGFSIDINCVLKLYFEITQKDQLYLNRRAGQVVGDNPFKSISKSEMIAKTIIQPQAHIFDIDKLNAKREDLALYQVIRQEPVIAQNPEAVLLLLKTMASNWSQKWRDNIGKLFPSIQEMKQKQIQSAVLAVDQYVKLANEQAKATGQPVKYDMNDLMQQMQNAVSDLVNPQQEEKK